MRDFKILVRYANPTESLSRYFTEISKEEILTPEKEAELAFLAKGGDEKAKDKLIRSNLRFVVSVAKAYATNNVPLEDLISEGNKGLIESADLFDPSTGFKFISYAVWHIRKYIFLYINNLSRSVRIPTNVTNDMRKYQSVEDSFVSYNGREPSIDEILEIMENNGDTISNTAIDTIKNKPTAVPLENPDARDDESTFSPINFIKSEYDTDNYSINEDMKVIISELLKSLSPIQREIMELKYGLGEFYKEPMSFSQIAEKLERTPEGIRLIAKKSERIMKLQAVKKRLNKDLF
jgi:RNA polymerase primary sigma factor